MTGRTKAFALREAVVLMGLTALAIPAVLAFAQKANDDKNRIQCADNLRQIGQALLLYSNENKGSYPRARYDFATADRVVFFTNWRSDDPFGPQGPGPNDVTAALYLLIRTQEIPASTFVCPSTPARAMEFGKARSRASNPTQPGVSDPVGAEERARVAKEHARKVPGNPGSQPSAEPLAESKLQISNLPSLEYLSYSYCNPYPGERALSDGFKPVSSSTLVLLADLNPGGKSVTTVRFDQMPRPEQIQTPYSPHAKADWKFTDEQRAANSPNHSGFGQNVLESGGTVSWQPTPFVGTRVGPASDNIYTRDLSDMDPAKRGDPIVGPPMKRLDTVLLPAADQK